MRGGAHEPVQIELIRVGSRRELLRPHERFHGGQLIRRGQPEIRVRSIAFPSQRPREVLGDGSRRERSQVEEAAAKSKRAKSQVEEVGRLAEHGRGQKPIDVFHDETTALREVQCIRARPHPLRIFQAEHRRTCNGAEISWRDARDASRTRVAVAHGAGQGRVHAVVHKIYSRRNLRQHLSSRCCRSASVRYDALQGTDAWRVARHRLGQDQRVEIEVEASILRLAEEQRIERRGDGTESRLDIARRQREVQARYVTSSAGPPIALESLAVEQSLALGDLGGYRDGERLSHIVRRCGCRIDREIGVRDGTTRGRGALQAHRIHDGKGDRRGTCSNGAVAAAGVGPGLGSRKAPVGNAVGSLKRIGIQRIVREAHLPANGAQERRHNEIGGRRSRQVRKVLGGNQLRFGIVGHIVRGEFELASFSSRAVEEH